MCFYIVVSAVEEIVRGFAFVGGTIGGKTADDRRANLREVVGCV
jgi:hypothetical protein